MFIGTEMIPLQCVVIRSEISCVSSGPMSWLRNSVIDNLIARTLNILYTTTGSLDVHVRVYTCDGFTLCEKLTHSVLRLLKYS